MRKILATSLVLATLTGAVQTAMANTGANTTPKLAVPAQAQAQKTWLGVSLAPVPGVLSKQLGSLIPENQGVMVRSVVPDSPAAGAGLQDYDILLNFNDQQLYSAQQLAGLVASAKPDSEVTLAIVRDGKKQELKVKLGSRATASGVPAHRGGHPMFGGMNRAPLMPQGAPNFWSRPFFRPDFNQPLFPQPPMAPKSSGQANVMQQFESISINTLSDGRYHAEVEFQENGGDKKKFAFEGKYDEIRKQISEEKGLPESKKNSLLNALKNNPDQLIPDGFMNLPAMPAFPAMPSFDPYFGQQPSWFRNGSKL